MYLLLYREVPFQPQGFKLFINANDTGFCICELYTYYTNTVMTLVKNISKQYQRVI